MQNRKHTFVKKVNLLNLLKSLARSFAKDFPGHTLVNSLAFFFIRDWRVHDNNNFSHHRHIVYDFHTYPLFPGHSRFINIYGNFTKSSNKHLYEKNLFFNIH